MSYYLKSGNTYRVTSKEAMDLHDMLPGGNYVIRQMPSGELYLASIDNFELKGKLYGRVLEQTKKILHTFSDRNGSTGILLSGEKGSGKTLLAKNICNTAAEVGIPTIVINAPWRGDIFNSFIQQITQPCIILFDEFEKVYDQPKQLEILTLLDGVFPSKKMFILTVNNKWGVDSHMRNRPGRIYYLLEFHGLEAGFIREYCIDNLKNVSYVETVCKVASVFDAFNFDMLKALVEEMNRFDESPQEAILMLNTRPEFSGNVEYTIKILADGKEVNSELLEIDKWAGNPMFGAVAGGYYTEVVPGPTPEDETGGEFIPMVVTPANIEKIDAKEGKFVYKVGKDTLILNRVRHAPTNYMNYLD